MPDITLRFEVDETGKITGNVYNVVTNGNGPEPPPPGDEEIYYIPTRWELGASSSDPSVGDGLIQAWYTKDEFTNGTRINLGLYIYAKNGSPGVGTGGYEIYLDDELEPDLDWYSGHANLWIAGGGVSEFDGSIKWSFRNPEKGPKLIFTFNGQEWNPTSPKNFNELKLRASIRYYL